MIFVFKKSCISLETPFPPSYICVSLKELSSRKTTVSSLLTQIALSQLWLSCHCFSVYYSEESIIQAINVMLKNTLVEDDQDKIPSVLLSKLFNFSASVSSSVIWG